MTDEVNAAIAGAKAAGATHVLVNDSHGSMTNLLIEDLDEDAVLITGSQKLLGMMEGIDCRYDAAMLIGYHARHNTSGVLAHSYYGIVVSEVVVNGMVVGEFEFNALLAAEYGVPIVFVSGDNVLSGQVLAFNPHIETLIVKEAKSRYTAQCVHPKTIHELMASGVKDALKDKLKQIPAKKMEGPIALEVAFLNSGMAEATLLLPNVELMEPNRVRYVAKDIVEAYKMRAALTIMAQSTL